MRWERRQKNEKESYNKNRYGDTDSSVVFYSDACSVFIRLFRREAVVHGYRKRRTFQYRLSMDSDRSYPLPSARWGMRYMLFPDLFKEKYSKEKDSFLSPKNQPLFCKRSNI